MAQGGGDDGPALVQALAGVAGLGGETRHDAERCT